MQEEQEVASGAGWRMLRPDEGFQDAPVVGLAEAVERYGKKRSHNSDDLMEGIEVPSGSSATVPPPRKKARAAALPQISTVNAAAPPSPLPSPHGSPPPEAIWPSAPPSGTSSPLPQAPFQPDLSLTTLLTLPSLLGHFTSLPPPDTTQTCPVLWLDVVTDVRSSDSTQQPDSHRMTKRAHDHVRIDLRDVLGV